jgi:hypothetical protein
MIKISLDEAYVFDLLSILDLKKAKSIGKEDNQKHIENYNTLYSEISEQITDIKMQEIIESEEYKDLVDINTKVFDLVDLGKEQQGLARTTAMANFDRFILKNKLQKKFFKNPLKEAKIGYDKV